MSRTGNLKVSRKGRVGLPEAVRGRWRLQDGGEVVFLDLGDGLLIVPASAMSLDHKSLQHLVGTEESPSGAPSARSTVWPPDRRERIAFSVARDRWEVPWGRHDEFGTPAYWVAQTTEGGYADQIEAETMDDLRTATVWGVLHGSQVRAKVGNAFWERMLEVLEKDPLPTPDVVEAVLRTPIAGFGRYRWPNRAAGISEAIARLAADPPPEHHARRIEYLEGLPGVGPKTARLIERGFRGLKAEVHINDIWLRRALLSSGVFRTHWDHNRHYGRFEDAFLQYARCGNVRPTALDLCIWELAQEAGSQAFDQPG